MMAKPVNVGIRPRTTNGGNSGPGGHQSSQIPQGHIVGFQSGEQAEGTLTVEAAIEKEVDFAAPGFSQSLASGRFKGIGFHQRFDEVGDRRLFDIETIETHKPAIGGFRGGSTHA